MGYSRETQGDFWKWRAIKKTCKKEKGDQRPEETASCAKVQFEEVSNEKEGRGRI